MNVFDALLKVIIDNNLTDKAIFFKFVHAIRLAGVDNDLPILKKHFAGQHIDEYECTYYHLFQFSYGYAKGQNPEYIMHDLQANISSAEAKFTAKTSTVFRFHMLDDINSDICKHVCYMKDSNTFVFYSSTALYYDLQKLC